jgi:hypothetical protein
MMQIVVDPKAFLKEKGNYKNQKERSKTRSKKSAFKKVK